MYDEGAKTTAADPRELGIVGASLNAAKEQAPLANAYMNQEKALAELEMMLEQLERRLDPISTRYDEPQRAENDKADVPSSEIVRAFKSNSDKIHRLSERVRRMTNELEV